MWRFADEIRELAGGRRSPSLHWAADVDRSGIFDGSPMVASTFAVLKSPAASTSLGRFRALTKKDRHVPVLPRFSAIPAHRAPPAIRFQYHRRTEDGGAPSRRRHHRLRHGQSRRPDARAHRREAGRDGAASGYARLFGVAGYRACAARSASGISGATMSNSIPIPKQSSLSARRRASPTWRWQPLGAATRCWCPIRAIRSTSTAR